MKILNFLFWGLTLSLSLCLVSCNGCNTNKADKKTETSESTSETTETQDGLDGLFTEARKSLDALEDATNNVGDGEAKEVDLEALKDWIPSRFMGLERKSREISKSGIFGIDAVTGTAVFGEGDEQVELEVVHFGGFQQFLTAMAAWSQIDIYKEGDDYYEKTVEKDGMKSFVKYNFQNERGEYSTFTDDYLINLKIRGLSEKRFIKSHNELRISKLPKPKVKK